MPVITTGYGRTVPKPGASRYLGLAFWGYVLEVIFFLTLVLVIIFGGIFLYLTWAYFPNLLIRLKAVISLGLVLFIASIVPALFVFVRIWRPFGLQILRGRHRRLWALIDSAAKDAGTKTADIVFLTHDFNAAVTQTRGIFGIGSKRILIIGLPLFSVLEVEHLRSTLLHEFGHFSGGHTLLSGWIIRSEARMAKLLAHSTDEEGRYGCMAGLIVAIYSGVFFRLHAEIQRRQEYYADELALKIVGRTVFEEKLRRIYTYGALLSSFWDEHAERALDTGFGYFKAFREYSQSAQKQGALSDLEAEASAEEITPYDSHPSYSERCKFAKQFPPSESEGDISLAANLLDSPSAVENDLSRWMTVKLKVTPRRRKS